METEGINNKIQTISMLGYGYPKDDWFLKLFDASRKAYIRISVSNKISQSSQLL
jgi:hypothetical protein